MSSRDKILAAIQANQPALSPLPEITIPQSEEGLVERFTATATAIGSKVFEIDSLSEIRDLIPQFFNSSFRVVSSFGELSGIAEVDISGFDPHTLENVELAILGANIAVAENAALWLPEENTMQRVLPFIPQHLALVVSKKNLVPTMHEAYQKIGNSEYGYGVFIAGPSKTADIEQSLVLGAHGPRSMTVFLTK